MFLYANSGQKLNNANENEKQKQKKKQTAIYIREKNLL